MRSGTLDKIANAIKDARSVAIICHTNPDPDTVCSALSLYYALQYFEKEIHVFCDSKPAGKVALIDGVEVINRAYSPSYAVCVALDCSDIGRLGEDVDVFNSAKITINIDHHRTNTEFAHLNYVEPYASSTCEVMYKLLLRLDPKAITDRIAKLLYTGIVADSGAFTFPSTSNDTMVIAGELMRFNFNASEVCYEMIKKMPKRVFNLKLRALKSLVTYDKNTIGVVRYTDKDFKLTKTSIEDTSGLINEIINIESIKIAISITEPSEGKFKVSLRSKGDIDVSRAVEAFGGGGHKNASGCEMYGEYDDIMLSLLRECRRELCRA